MKTINILCLALISSCMIGLSGCGDSNTNKTTVVKKETKIDSNGNEKTKIETRTVETTDTAPRQEGGTTTVRIVEEKRDPVIKVGPLEIK